MRVCTLLLTLVVATEVTPVQKVIQLLEGMAEKGKKEKHAEQVQFSNYKQFCDDTATEKTRAIEEANDKMEQLNAAISKAEADAATLSREIAALDEDISVWTGDKKAATEVRELAAADYASTHRDYSESVDSITRAIATVSKQDVDRSQLLQVSLQKLVPESTKQIISAFLSQGEDDGADASASTNLLARDMAASAPQASAYEFQSAGIVEMLEKLGDKFEDERTDLEKKESNAKHAFSMLMQDLTAQIEMATADREAKAEQKAAKLMSAASDKGELADTTATRDSDQIYLDDLVATCSKKSADFENRQQLRTEELEAVQKAIEIMSSDSIGSGSQHLPTLVQTKKHVSFLQLSASSANPNQARVAAFLRAKASKFNSRVLSAMATHVAEDPFVKVRKMIKDLIVRLMEEANEEAEHKGWCDTELSSNEQTRKEKTSSVETLQAGIDELSAAIAKGAQEITDLNTQISEIDATMAQATELRNAEKADNEATIRDAEAASTATQQAVTVLKQFYEKAGDATSLIQAKADPEIFDTEYKGMQSENGGVLGMLEVIASDFARLNSDTKSAEAQSQREYDDLAEISSSNRSQNAKDVDHKTTKKTNEESALNTKQGDLTGTQLELDTALAYYDKLKPSCVNSGVSFDDRVARRQEEVDSLQEALKILNGEDIAFLQK